VPWCSRDLSASTLSVVTERQHLVDSIAELTLLCNEATRRSQARNDVSSSSSSLSGSAVPTKKKLTKPLSIEYIFDRIDTDDPIWGLMVRTNTPVSFKGRPSNFKASPLWKRGMLQGFITMTTFTNWQSSFRFDSLSDMAFGQDDDELEAEMKSGLRKYDKDGSLAEELEASVKGGNPHMEGIVYPRIAEVSLFGGLGCGKQLLRLLIEHLERLKASADFNYDYVVLQATENSIPFYEAMGFIRVGCVQGQAASPNKIITSPVEEYHTKKNGESPVSVAKQFGVDVWDLVFLNKPLWPELVQKSWLKMGTKLFIPKPSTSPKWYMALNNETPRGIAKKFGVNFSELLRANKRRYPDLTGNAKLMKGTNIQISRFHIDEGDTVAYTHWTFPDAELDDDDVSYMMAMKLNRKKGAEAKVKPLAFSLPIPMKPYCPVATGVKNLLIQPGAPKASLAPIFAKKKGPKEPKKPKRPMSAYMHFMSVARTTMAEELKGLSFIETNGVISAKWKTMWDDEKIPYEERAGKSKVEYDEAMKKYVIDMERFRRESPPVITDLDGVDVSLLEKVVKLKASHGITGVAKFEYFYVLTFIPDLQWVHLIPMRKVGVFGPEHGQASGRLIWMIYGEDEGKEIDTTASLCEAVTAFTVKNSADADDEQWNIYDNGETPPAPLPAPTFTSEAKIGAKTKIGVETKTGQQTKMCQAAKIGLDAKIVPPLDAPTKPKKPAASFAIFCREASSTMKEELENMPFSERVKIIAVRWKEMTIEEKQKYKDQYSEAHQKYSKALKEYKENLETYLRENPASSAAILSKTPKSSKKNKGSAVQAGEKAPQETSSSFILSKTPKPSKMIKIPPVKAEDRDSQDTPSSVSTKTPKSTPNMKIKTPAANTKKFRPLARPSTPSPVISIKSPNSTKETKSPTLTATKFPPNVIASSSPAIQHKTLKYEEKIKPPVMSGKKRGRPRKDSLPTPQSKPNLEVGEESLALKSKEKIKPPVTSGKKRERPRKDSLPTSQAKPSLEVEIEPPARKRKKGRLRNHTLPNDVLLTLHTVKKDPAELEKLRGELTGDRELKQTNATTDKTNKDVITLSLMDDWNDVILSLKNDKYKTFMWSHFKKLGRKEKGGKGEAEMGRNIFLALQKGLGEGGAFFKKSRDGEICEVDDDVALQKIIRDLKSRMESSRSWLGSNDGDTSSAEKSPTSTPSRNGTRGSGKATKTIELQVKPRSSQSRYPRRGAAPEPFPNQIMDKVNEPDQIKASPLTHRSGKEDTHTPSSPAQSFLGKRKGNESPRSIPSPSATLGSRKSTRTTELRVKPHSSPSRYPRRGAGPPSTHIMDTVNEPKRRKASPLTRHSGEEDTHIPSSQAQGILGKGEAKATELAPSTATTKMKRPLAPIFLKSYDKKKNPPAESKEPKESPRKSSRYPERKRKQLTDDTHVVSDDAVSETSINKFEPRTKKAKTKC